MRHLRIYIADDHAVIRDGVRHLIDSEPDMAVVGEASNGEGAVEGVGRLSPHVVVMDVSMPGIGGIEATRRIFHSRPWIRVIALTTHEGAGYRRAMFEAGACGYVLKRAAPEYLIEAIRKVASGEAFIAPGADDGLESSR
ncbi:response regulator [Singulisphaera sp. PoT]|uniref:response regulator n=1 Tax=Singulisphaera sp. PoT TaxID=3411797 RepID=UPI003BF4F4E7